MTILGAVLAGGASSRFGSDKALAVVGGRTLLDRARDTLAPVCDAVVVVGRGAVPDRPGPALGPLGGIAGALDHGAHEGYASVLTIGCDMPWVPAALLEALSAQLPACCAEAPVLGHWPTMEAATLLARLRGFAKTGAQAAPLPLSGREGAAVVKDPRLSVRRWAASIGAVAIASPVPLRNVNTPADLPSS